MHLVGSVIPRRWWQLVAAMSTEQATAWERNNKERFEYCLKDQPQKGKVSSPEDLLPGDLCHMVQALVKDINFGQMLEGPRGPISAMLQREVSHNECRVAGV